MRPSLFLKSLSLRNFATFENQEIQFHSKFNGIVGETGSGKSLILDAFQLLLGGRADKKLVRKGTDCAMIEGVFEVQGDKFISYFDEIGFPIVEEGNTYQVVIKRIIYNTGKSKSYLNHFSSPLAVLSKFSKTFVDLVGQFENQKLTQQDYQLHLLDQFSNVEEKLEGYSKLFHEYKTLCQEIDLIKETLSNKSQKEDYIRFQMQALEQLNPSVEDENKLISLKDQLLNSEETQKNLELLKEYFSEGDTNLLQLSKHCSKLFSKCNQIFTEEERSDFETLLSSIEDFSYIISKADIDIDEETSLDDVLDRLDQYQKLKRKFNIDTFELKGLLNEFQDQITELENIENRFNSLLADKDKLETKLYEQASKLHDIRVKNATQLSKQIGKGLSELNMSGATFDIQVSKLNTLGPTGLSQANFLAETNKGEGFYKIKDIASGGELSRILLCLRQIVASEDTINIFFFDEIDTGIGGETASKIAKALKKVGEKGQVLAITHLPQIAKEVDEIIYVDKKSLSNDKNTRTISFVSIKRGDEREQVINQLAGL